MDRVAWLSGTGADGKAARWKLEGEVFTIGRKAPADLVVPLLQISRQHARITREPEGYFLCDLDSRNGTFVNGQPVARTPQRLYGGDEIVLGGVAIFRFEDPDETVQGPRLGRFRGVWIDRETLTVWVDAQPIEPPISPAQYTLLELLYREAGKIVSRDEIIATVWPEADPAGVSMSAINGLIKRLRERLRETQLRALGHPPEEEYLEVLRGHGLRLNHPEC